MKKCIVIGGGIAGLTASAYLVNSGFQVELIEASPKLGGRVHSFLHKETDTIVDNGQHIMMGCYKETLSFLKMINASEKISIQQKLSVKFLKPNYNLHILAENNLFYPMNLLSAILNFSAIDFCDRISLIRLFLKIPFFAERDLEKLSVDELLSKEKQTESTKKSFWEIICVGALNTSLQKASAKVFVDVLKEIFLKGSKGYKIVLTKAPLSNIFCEPAQKFIEDKGGKIFLSEKVERVKVEKNKISEIITNKRRIGNFDMVVSSVPFYALQRIIDESKISYSFPNIFLNPLGSNENSKSNNLNHNSAKQRAFNPTYSSILNVHIWLKEKKFECDFYALIDSQIHWVFCNDTHLTCVISDADNFIKLSDDEIINIITKDLLNYLQVDKKLIKNYLIIKEKRATFIPSSDIINARPNAETIIKNLVLAGDWVNTGLPSTIESAAKSGRVAADLILNSSI